MMISVASWAVMGVVWEVCLASTEGLCEAASVRVSYYLMEGFPTDAKLLASKVSFLAGVQSLLLTSIFLLAGPNISNAFTNDRTLETMMNDLLTLTALAIIPMTLTQVYWSLLGTQGNYATASAAILASRWLVTVPIAAILVFGQNWEIDALPGSVAAGYATAAFVLSLSVFNTDWNVISLMIQEEMMPMEDDEDDEDEEADSEVDDLLESDTSDSDDFVL